MLVLTRKKNEAIVINNDIVVSVEYIGEGRVKLGIVAPKNVPVHRQEVYDLIQAGGGSTTQTEAVDGDPLNE